MHLRARQSVCDDIWQLDYCAVLCSGPLGLASMAWPYVVVDNFHHYAPAVPALTYFRGISTLYNNSYE